MTAYEVAKQTLWVLTPELLMLVVATAMMTAGAFVRAPRRVWSITAAATHVVALLVLLSVWNQRPDAYAAAAVNDELSLYARLGFLLTGLVILGLAHDQVDNQRAAEFFGALLMVNA